MADAGPRPVSKESRLLVDVCVSPGRYIVSGPLTSKIYSKKFHWNAVDHIATLARRSDDFTCWALSDTAVLC